MKHDQRSSAMNTFIKPNLKFNWPIDSDPYTDQWLWMRNNIGINDKKIINPKWAHSIGIKHGFTMTGGKNHVDRLHRYVMDDSFNMTWLRYNTDAESMQFYLKMSKVMDVYNKMVPDDDYSDYR